MASYIFLFLKMCQKPLRNTYKCEQQHQPIFSPFSRRAVFLYSLIETIQAKSDNYFPHEIRFLNFINLFTINFYHIKHIWQTPCPRSFLMPMNINFFIDYEAPTYAQE